MSATQVPRWTPEVKAVYRVYPAAIRSKLWPEIVKLALKGDIQNAKELAATQEKRSLSIRSENIIARRMRVLSAERFTLRIQQSKDLKTLFREFTTTMAASVSKKADGISSIHKVNDDLHDAIVSLRSKMKVLLTDNVWKSILMGIRHMGEAAKPIFRQNQESFAYELYDIAQFEVPNLQRYLLEARASTSVTAKLPGGARPTADLSTDKWQKITDGIYHDIAKSSLRGLSLSERIWDLTNRAEQDMKRKIASMIANGDSARDIADKITKDVFVNGVDDDFTGGPGVYKSPLKNADRLARTEISRAYTKAQTNWADGKEWLQGLRVTLSDAHDKTDICDQFAGKIYSPEEFEAKCPFHPYCQCTGTFVIKDKYLTAPEENDDD